MPHPDKGPPIYRFRYGRLVWSATVMNALSVLRPDDVLGKIMIGELILTPKEQRQPDDLLKFSSISAYGHKQRKREEGSVSVGLIAAIAAVALVALIILAVLIVRKRYAILRLDCVHGTIGKRNKIIPDRLLFTRICHK